MREVRFWRPRATSRLSTRIRGASGTTVACVPRSRRSYYIVIVYYHSRATRVDYQVQEYQPQEVFTHIRGYGTSMAEFDVLRSF